MSQCTAAKLITTVRQLPYFYRQNYSLSVLNKVQGKSEPQLWGMSINHGLINDGTRRGIRFSFQTSGWTCQPASLKGLLQSMPQFPFWSANRWRALMTLGSSDLTPLYPGFGCGTGYRLYVWKFHQLFAVGQWFPPGTPVSSNSEIDISSSPYHCFDMTLAVAEVLSPNQPTTKAGDVLVVLCFLPRDLSGHESSCP